MSTRSVQKLKYGTSPAKILEGVADVFCISNVEASLVYLNYSFAPAKASSVLVHGDR